MFISLRRRASFKSAPERERERAMLRVDSCLLLLAAHAGLHTHTHAQPMTVALAYACYVATVLVWSVTLNLSNLLVAEVCYTQPTPTPTQQSTIHTLPLPLPCTHVWTVWIKRNVFWKRHIRFRHSGCKTRERERALCCAHLRSCAFVLSRSLWF